MISFVPRTLKTRTESVRDEGAAGLGDDVRVRDARGVAGLSDLAHDVARILLQV